MMDSATMMDSDLRRANILLLLSTLLKPFKIIVHAHSTASTLPQYLHNKLHLYNFNTSVRELLVSMASTVTMESASPTIPTKISTPPLRT